MYVINDDETMICFQARGQQYGKRQMQHETGIVNEIIVF
jgi:hypothetical protein